MSRRVADELGQASAGRALPGEADGIAGGSAYLFAAQLVGNTGFFVAVLVLARILEPAGRGTVAFVIVAAMVAARIAGIGVREATMVFAAQRPADRPTLLTNLLCAGGATGAAMAVLVCGCLVLLGDARPSGVGQSELAALAIGIVVAAQVDGGYFFLTGCGRFRQQALVTMSSSWLYAGMLLVLAGTGGLTVASAVWVWVVGQAVRGALVLGSVARDTRLGAPDLALLRKTVSFGSPAWLGSVARFMNFRADQILMGFIATEATLGIYAVAVNASEILLYLPEATATALLPVAARSAVTGRPDRALGAFRILIVVTALGVIVAAVVGWPLLPIVFGDEFVAAQSAFLLLLPGAFGYAALGVFSNALLASAPGRSSAGPIVSLVVGLTLDVALIPRYGASGAAAAASIAFLAGGTAAALVYRRREPFRIGALVPRRADVRRVRELAGQALARVIPRHNKEAHALVSGQVKRDTGVP